jgi:hypothetical protein
VRLPARFAKAAVEQLLRICNTNGEVVEGPCAAELFGRALTADEWAIRIPPYVEWPRIYGDEVLHRGREEVHIFRRNTVFLAAAHAKWLLRALEQIKPEELDANGLPLPWVPVRHTAEALGPSADREDDAAFVESAAEITTSEQETSDGSHRPIRAEEIRGWFRELARLAGFDAETPLSISRGTIYKHGLTTGRVWFTRAFKPLRVHITTCPNADAAEILATLTHELTHPLARTTEHTESFKAELLRLAGRRWGDRWFAEARRHLGESYHVVDAWVATGIRAALREADPPIAREGDDGQMARIVTRIRKLRELAIDQLGTPEGINATAAGNDLVTSYGLGDYSVRIDAGIEEQMIDRHVRLENDAIWRRDLAHAVARHFDVFSLHVNSKSRMHLFGRYADVVAAEYLYEVTSAQIARECERHIDEWRSMVGRPPPGEVVRERVSFCDSAVAEFSRKLSAIAREERGTGRSGGRSKSDALEAAEEFARTEHEKRGSSWHSGTGKVRRDNAAGRRVGGSLEVVRGMSASGGVQRRLPGRASR